MKRIIVLGVLMLLLSGCSSPTLETMGDSHEQPLSKPLRQLQVSLPEDAVVMTMEDTQGNMLYLCDGYTVATYVLPAEDMDSTLVEISGYDSDRLRLIQTMRDGLACYQCAWSAAGEGVPQTGRAVILEDGNFHYAVTVMGDVDTAGEYNATWQHILDSATACID